MEDIKIITDTCSDLPEEIAEKYDIGIVRFLTIFGDKEYMNGKDITNKEFFEKLESFDGIPTSSQPPFQYLYDLLLEESKKHKTVIFFTMSSKASGEFQTANLIASQIKEDDNPDADIRIVDTEKLSVYMAQTAVYAAQLVRDGKTADEVIEESMKYIKTWRAYIVVDTLKYLEKGGRLSKSASIVGTLLDIKPILTVEGGLVDSYGKLRGKKKLVDKVIEKIEENPAFHKAEKKEFLVLQSDEKRGEEACEKLREKYGEDCVVMYAEVGPLIGIHLGKGAFAIVCRVCED